MPYPTSENLALADPNGVVLELHYIGHLSFKPVSKGKTSVSFFHSDEVERFQLVIEGTDDFGALGTTVFASVKKST